MYHDPNAVAKGPVSSANSVPFIGSVAVGSGEQVRWS